MLPLLRASAFTCLLTIATQAAGQETCSPELLFAESNSLPSGYDITGETNWVSLVENSINCSIETSEWPNEGLSISIQDLPEPYGFFEGFFFDASNGVPMAAFTLNSDLVESDTDALSVAFFDLRTLQADIESWTAFPGSEPLLTTEDFALSGMRFIPYQSLDDVTEDFMDNAIAASLVLPHVVRFSFSSAPTGATVFVGAHTFETVQHRAYRPNEVALVRMSLDGFDDCILTPDDFIEDRRNGFRVIHCNFKNP